MVRNTPFFFYVCAQLPGLFAIEPASAEDLCGKVRGGQYAEEQVCTNVLHFPDGKPAPAAMLDAIPDTYPWLFPFSEGELTPQQKITITGAQGGFSTLQFINGWAPYDTTGAEATQFQKFSRVKDILIETGSGHSLRHTLQDTGETQFITLPKPAAEGWVSVKILSVYPGESRIVALRWFSIAWEADL
jgi:hypothetical protein